MLETAPLYYVYVHCRPDGTPFYVGKGTIRRARSVKAPRNKYYKHTVNKYGAENIAMVLCGFRCEEAAFVYEQDLIHVYRNRKYNLCNLTEGGEGAPKGNKYNLGKIFTTEHKRKISDRLKGNKNMENYVHTPEHKANISLSLLGHTRNKGMVFTDAHKQNISKANKGRIFTPEHRAKILASIARKKIPYEL